MTDFARLHSSMTILFKAVAGSPARACVALGTICVALVCGSLFVQHVLQVEPCPLCIVQRLTYAALAIVFLVAGLVGARPGLRRSLLGLALALILGGIGVAAYQSQLQLFPAVAAATCSPSLSYMFDTLPAGEVVGRLFQGHGDCSDTSFTILGLTLAQISLGVFASLLLAVGALLRRRSRSVV